MSQYNGPEIPDDPEDFEHITEDDVLRQINEAFGEEELNTIEISENEAQEIRDFLVNFNVKNADAADIEDINLVWHRLKGNPSLVKDLVYNLMTWKETLNHSTHPLAVSWEEIVQYAGHITADDVRPWLISQTAPAIKRLGFDSFHYTDRALSESNNPRVRPDATRYLGWLVSQGFLVSLPEKKKEFMRKHELSSFTLPNLATIATVGVADELKRLDNMNTAYRSAFDMEREAREQVHDEIMVAMRGIYRMCGVMFLKKGGSEK